MRLAGLRIGLLTASASRAGGGVFEAVVQQAALIRDAGGEAIVFALADPYAAADAARFGDVPVRLSPVLGPRRFGYAPELLRKLIAADLDLLHLHGIWMYPSRAGARWARATGRPYLISPHGMLDPWILARGRLQKAVACAAYERDGWRRAAVLHALTDDEGAAIAAATGRAHAAVVPNAAPAAGPPRHAGGGALYLGRIHPKKNLHALVEGWRALGTIETLTIAGWGDAAHVAALVAQVAGVPNVRFVGAAHGADKQRLLEQARWLVLPSLSEGLPMAVLEAWAAGTPAVMTAACHLPEGFAAGAALPCGDTPAAIATALAAALAEDDARWRQRSDAARALAAGPFSTAAVAERWTTLYRGGAA